MIPAEVIAAARQAPHIHLRKKDEPFRTAIVCDDRVVGFCHPHDTAHGFRLGPIFVMPEFRGRGLTRQAYADHAAGRECIAFIHNGNVGSEKAHEAAGFVRGRRLKGGQFWHREATHVEAKTKRTT
jgi:L-amino acid N-acyltransferase YncA